jgi:chromosome segregation ATPase
MEIANIEGEIGKLVARLAKLQPDPEVKPEPFKCPAYWTKEDATDCIRKLDKKLAFQDACLASNDKKFARLRTDLKAMRDERNNAKAMARNLRRTPPTAALGNALKEQRAENKALNIELNKEKQENKQLDKENVGLANALKEQRAKNKALKIELKEEKRENKALKIKLEKGN